MIKATRQPSVLLAVVLRAAALSGVQAYPCGVNAIPGNRPRGAVGKGRNSPKSGELLKSAVTVGASTLLVESYNRGSSKPLTSCLDMGR